MHAELVRDHVLGAVFGMAVGDALGAPYNGRSASEIQMRLGNAPLRMEGNPRAKLEAGDWTDGTGQALAVIESFNSCKGFEGLDCAGQLVNWFQLNPKGLGFFTRDVLRDLALDPEKWDTVGRDHWIRRGGVPAGSGALVRCLIPAIFYRDDIERMVSSTIQLCQITHFDPRCVESALAINYALLQCLHRRYRDGLVDEALTFLRATRTSPLFNKLVQRYSHDEMMEYSNWSPYPNYDLDSEAVVDRLAETRRIRFEDLHNTGKASHSMQAALWCLSNATSFTGAVDRAIRLGGEASIQGALAGALAGARFGLSHIPSEWVSGVRNSRRIAVGAENLLGRSTEVEEKETRDGDREPIARPPRIL